MRGITRREVLRKSALGVGLAALLPFGATVARAPAARAAFDPSGFDFWVESSMGPIKSRIFRAADGNTNWVVYALDGMRARDDLNGWEIETNVAQALTDANINVVMPVGGRASFYADWNEPSTFADTPAGTDGGTADNGWSQMNAGGPGKTYTYKWETFLTQDLRNALRDRLSFNATRNGVFGLSMSGSSALQLAAFHADQFSFAGSFSGVLDMSMAVIRQAIRVAMIDAGGYNIDSMAGPKDKKWGRIDPVQFASRLKSSNTRLWVSCGSTLPAEEGAVDDTQVNAIGLEAVALLGTRSFEAKFASIGGRNASFNYPAVGVHDWANWEARLTEMLPDLSANIG
nr:alpha/beta hydrolase family protein [Nocardia crassostreae]